MNKKFGYRAAWTRMFGKLGSDYKQHGKQCVMCGNTRFGLRETWNDCEVSHSVWMKVTPDSTWRKLGEYDEFRRKFEKSGQCFTVWEGK